jgi:glycosyltransferase involved in cell wall biosynthesis
VGETDATVILVTGGAGELFPLAAGHLEQQTFPSARFEVIVADVSAEGATAERAGRYADGAPMRIQCIHIPGATVSGARNRALDAARGAYVVFLDDDLLASPELVEAHVRAQERQPGGLVIAGNIERHPQIAPRALTRLHDPTGAGGFVPNQPLRFIDWRCHNASIPRERIVRAGGFDEGFARPGMEDLDLAWRLERDGLTGRFTQGARAFTWIATSLEREADWHYDRGHGLHRLLERTDSDLVRRRYKTVISRTAGLLRMTTVPACTLVASGLAGAFPAHQAACRQLLLQAMHRGYRDAASGRPPRTG